MKMTKFLVLALFISVALVSCNDDDTPEVVNEEEVITDVTLTFTDSEGSSQTYTYTDPQYREESYSAPDIQLTSGEAYDVEVNFYNNSDPEDPETITEEITEEKDDHFLEYDFSGADISLARLDEDVTDGNGVKIGLTTEWTAGEASEGSVTVTLIHQATSKDTTDPEGSHTGGSTDAQVSFDVTVN